MTEPEQWAVELAHQLDAPFGSMTHYALTIQRAFEERERGLREALEKVAKDRGGYMGEYHADCQQIARAALGEKP